ncbi:MAG: hypothetical protein WAV52_08065 [Luteococcus japonicus]
MRLTTVESPETRDHFGPNPWAPGERRLTFHLTLQASPEVYDAALRVQDVLEGQEHVRPVPRAWLHLTMSSLGREDAVDRVDLADVADRVFDQWPRFAGERIVYEQLLIADESVMLMARDDQWLQDLAEVQRRAVDGLLGERPWRRLQPHTSLAYLNGPVPVAGLAERLAPAAASLSEVISGPPVLTLMSLSRETGDYTWQVLRDEGPVG